MTRIFTYIPYAQYGVVCIENSVKFCFGYDHCYLSISVFYVTSLYLGANALAVATIVIVKPVLFLFIHQVKSGLVNVYQFYVH